MGVQQLILVCVGGFPINLKCVVPVLLYDGSTVQKRESLPLVVSSSHVNLMCWSIEWMSLVKASMSWVLN